MSLESVVIHDFSKKCAVTEIKYALPGSKERGSVEVMPIDPAECRSQVSMSQSLAVKRLTEFRANTILEKETIQKELCAYRPRASGLAIPSFSCFLMEMPIHPVSGKPVILKDDEKRNVAAGPLVIGGHSYGAKVSNRAIAVAIDKPKELPKETFAVPQDPTRFVYKVTE